MKIQICRTGIGGEDLRFTPISEPSREFYGDFQFNVPQRRWRGIVLREPCNAGVPSAGWPGVSPGDGTGGKTPPAPAAGDGRAALAPVQPQVALPFPIRAVIQPGV